jgi:hypothetical protein
MTYEKGLFAQADPGIVSGSTIERKKMSTKTIYKRIALVAVAGLVSGLVSVAPASAVLTAFTISKDSADSGVIKVTAAVTTTGVTNLTQTAGFTSTAVDAGKGAWYAEDGYAGKIVTVTNTGVAVMDGVVPATITAATALYTGNVAATVTQSGIVADAITGMAVKTGANGLLNIRGNAVVTGTAGKARFLVNGVQIGASDVTSAATDGGLILPFTAPLTVGTYVGSVQVTDAGTWAEAITQSFTLTVTASPTLSTALSTAHMTAPSAGGVNASVLTNAIPRSAVRTADTGIAQVKVTLLKDDGTAETAAHTITAEVSGVGYVSVNQTADTPATPKTRSATTAAGASVNYVHINSDGTAGTGTVTVSVTHVTTAVKTTLGTFSYSSFGSVAKLAVSTSIYKVGLAGGGTTGRALNARVVDTAANSGALNAGSSVPAFIVKATDSADRVATATAVPVIVSGTPTVVSGGTCALDDGSAPTTASSSTNGVGFYNCNFVTTTSAKSGDKATLTIRIVDPADATKFISTTYDVTVGGSVATETLAFDKTSYAPGEALVITRTAKDSAGNPVADGSASPAVTFNKAVGGTAPAAGFYNAGVSASATSSATSGVFAPVIGGALVATATSGNAAASTITASTTVTDGNAALTTLVNSLIAKINALNKLVIKIQKKVRA